MERTLPQPGDDASTTGRGRSHERRKTLSQQGKNVLTTLEWTFPQKGEDVPQKRRMLPQQGEDATTTGRGRFHKRRRTLPQQGEDVPTTMGGRSHKRRKTLPQQGEDVPTTGGGRS